MSITDRSRSQSFSTDFAPPDRVNLEKICSKAPQVRAGETNPNNSNLDKS